MRTPMDAERCMGRDGFGRIRYASPAKAKKARIKMRGLAGTPLRVYKCPRCRGWHLTSSS